MTTDNQRCGDNHRTNFDVKKYGIAVIEIEATSYFPSFAYSVGLIMNFNHPEIICFGLNAHSIVNDCIKIIKSGKKIEAYAPYNNILNNKTVAFVQVDKEYLSDYFENAVDFYGNKDFPALQLVWKNRNDSLPCEESLEDWITYNYPLLDRDFLKPENKKVITTRQWIEDEEPIMLVIHWYDGDWYFLTGDQTIEDLQYVAFEQIVCKDNTLNQLFDLDDGEQAKRNFIGEPWKRKYVDKWDLVGFG